MIHEKVRILRILEYTGDREAIERGLELRAVKGFRHFGNFVIREATLGEFPEILNQGDPG